MSILIRGIFTGQTDSFDASRHAIQASVYPAGQLRRAIRERAQAQKLEGVKPRPNPLQYIDTNSGESNALLTPGSLGRLSGHRLKFDPADANQGIFLTHLNNGNTPVRVEVVGKNCPTELMFLVPPTLPAGEYSLTVRAVFGQDGARAGMLDAVLNVP